MDQYCRKAKEKICLKNNKERILKIFVHAVLRNKYNFILKWFNLNLIFILFINVQKCAKLRPIIIILAKTSQESETAVSLSL